MNIKTSPGLTGPSFASIIPNILNTESSFHFEEQMEAQVFTVIFTHLW